MEQQTQQAHAIDRETPHDSTKSALPTVTTFPGKSVDISVTRLKLKKVIGTPFVLAVAIGFFWDGGSRLKADTREIIADPPLSAGPVKRWLFGDNYRHLWTTPIEVEVLDFSREAGGLKPLFRVGGAQTFGLALEGADGKSYTFRSLVKDQTENLHPDLRDREFGRISQDQLSALHPAATVMVPPLAKAAGVLHNTPRHILLPDDPALGEFRELFAGRIGTLEEFPTPASDGYAGFNGATDIIKSDEIVDRFLANPDDRVDGLALVRARLFDFFLGDWDRHANNFRWAKLPDKAAWQPLPEDRDQAFVSFKGAVLSVIRPFEPRLLRFEKEYPSSFGLTTQGWPIHRWFLAELDRDTWIETAVDMQSRITDEVIEEAAGLMPKPYYALNGEKLVSTLKARRDKLPEVADRIYHFLNKEVDLQATDASERIDLTDLGQGMIEVSVTAKTAEEPYFKRQLTQDETKSLRVYLRAGQDTVVCQGALDGKIKIDVIGSQAEDVLQGCETANLRFTESEEIERRKQPLRIAPAPFEKLTLPTKNIPAPADRPRDWGTAAVPIYQASFSSEDGLILGYGRNFSLYEFGKNPFGQRHAISAAVSLGEGTFDVVYDGTFQHWNPKLQSSLAVSVASIEQADFFGFGNGTSDNASDDFFETDQTRATISPSISYLVTQNFNTFSGVEINYNSTDDNDDTLLNQLAPFGVGDFGWVNIFAGVDYNTRDLSSFNNPGFHFRLQASVSPELWDVDSTFGSVEGEVAGYFSIGSRSLLALRLGGENVSGTFPFEEAAYIGGDENVRGFDNDRFAGDASVFSNVELRYSLGRASAYLSEADYSVFVFGDVGRVFTDIDGDSNEYHSSGGAGISASALDRTFLLSLAAAVSDEKTTGVFTAGYSF